MLDVPPRLQEALQGERPDFVAKASRPMPPQRARLLVLIGAAALAGDLAVGAFLLGAIEADEVLLPASFALLASVVLGGFLLAAGVHGLRGEGPWIAATAKGLLLVTPRGHRLHPWSDLADARAGDEAGSVVLVARPGVQLSRIPLAASPGELPLVGLDDPRRVLEGVHARLRASTGPSPATGRP